MGITAGQLFGLGVGNAALNAGTGLLSQWFSSHLNEKAAQNADQRTRQLYHDLYSPIAQAAQLRNAGLSVGLMYAKGGIGGSGQAGAQAAPATNQLGNLFDIANLQMQKAQIDNINADTAKKKEEAKNIQSGTRKTDAEIENLLEENGLIKLKKDYQALCNDIKVYEKVFSQETTETNIEIQKRTLDNLIEQGKKLHEEAKTAGADAIVAESTINERIQQAAQQVAINDMQLKAMQNGIRLNEATIDKIKADIFNNETMRQIAEAKAPQEIEEIKQKMINDCERIIMEQQGLKLKEKQFIWDIIKGAFDIFNRANTNVIGAVKVAGDIIK